MTKQKQVINVSFPSGLLGLIFVLLKVSETVTWPWLWVLAPFWLPWAAFGAILAGLAVFTLLSALFVSVSYFMNLLRSRK